MSNRYASELAKDMNVTSIESNPVEERRNDDNNAYPIRTDEELEQLIEEAMQEPGDMAGSIQEVRDILNDSNNGVRGSVGNHNQAPIRSLLNPEENSGVIKSRRVEMLETPGFVYPAEDWFGDEKKNIQVAGEEFFVNANLDNLPHIGSVQWWTVYDDGRYSEEDPGGRGEHLSENNREAEMHKYRLEVDGELLDPEESWRFAKQLKRARDNEITENDITEVGRIPELVLEYDNPEDITESEDKNREEFDSEYGEAQNLGLVTGNGNVTLKGWLSAVDMESLDVRQLEEVVKEREEINFRNGGQEAIETLLSNTNRTVSCSADLRATYPDSRINFHTEDYEGEIEEPESKVKGGLSSLKDDLEALGIEYSTDLSELIRGSVDVEDFREVIQDSENSRSLEDQLLEEFPELLSENPNEAKKYVRDDLIEINDVKIPDIDFELTLHPDTYQVSKDEAREIAEDNFGISSLENEIAGKLEDIAYEFDDQSDEISISYEGEDEFWKDYLEGQHALRDSNVEEVVSDSEIKGNFDGIPLLIKSLEDDISDQGGSIKYEPEEYNSSLTVENYDSFDEELKNKLESIEDLTDSSGLRKKGDPKIKFKVNNEEEMKELMREVGEHEQSLLFYNSKSKHGIDFDEFQRTKYIEDDRGFPSDEVKEDYEKDLLKEVVENEGEIELKNHTYFSDLDDFEGKLEGAIEKDLVELQDPSSIDLEYTGEGRRIAGRFSVEPELDYESNLDSNQVDLMVRQNENSSTYEVSDELERIAENLNPLNLQKEPYKDIEIETGFEYTEQNQKVIA